MPEQTRLIRLDVNDPDHALIKDTIFTYNYIGEKLGKVVGEKFNLILWIVSILLSGLIGTFIQARNYIWAFIFGNILLVFVIYFVITKNEELEHLWGEYKEQKEEVKNRGIPLPKKPKKKSFFILLYQQFKEGIRQFNSRHLTTEQDLNETP